MVSRYFRQKMLVNRFGTREIEENVGFSFRKENQLTKNSVKTYDLSIPLQATKTDGAFPSDSENFRKFRPEFL